jgi:hypothetical protein
MTIRVGERLPAGTLMEMNEAETPGCPARCACRPTATPITPGPRDWRWT